MNSELTAAAHWEIDLRAFSKTAETDVVLKDKKWTQHLQFVSAQSDEPVIVCGKWGSGKTAIRHMLRDQYDAENAKISQVRQENEDKTKEPVMILDLVQDPCSVFSNFEAHCPSLCGEKDCAKHWQTIDFVDSVLVLGFTHLVTEILTTRDVRWKEMKLHARKQLLLLGCLYHRSFALAHDLHELGPALGFDTSSQRKVRYLGSILMSVLRAGLLGLFLAQIVVVAGWWPDQEFSWRDIRVWMFVLGCMFGSVESNLYTNASDILKGLTPIRVTKSDDIRTKEIDRILACHIKPDEVRTLLGDFASRESPPKVLESFSHLVRECGYSKTVVFIDSIDEAAPMKPQFLLKVLDSILDYSLFSVPNLRMVLMFPCTLDEAEGRMKRRPDRSAVIKLDWSSADLFSFLEKRFPNLVKMCERLPKDQATRLKDDYLSQLETPRQALSFVKTLLSLSTPELDYKPGPKEFEMAVLSARAQNPALMVRPDEVSNKSRNKWNVLRWVGWGVFAFFIVSIFFILLSIAVNFL